MLIVLFSHSVGWILRSLPVRTRPIHHQLLNETLSCRPAVLSS